MYDLFIFDLFMSVSTIYDETIKQLMDLCLADVYVEKPDRVS